MLLSVSAPIRYHVEGEKRPKKHQLLLEFEDGTAISSSAQMWGGFFLLPGGREGRLSRLSTWPSTRPSPLTDAFDRAYFDTLFNADTPKLSAKAFLATEQRIPGLGNGVLQDILWTARIHPKRKMGELSDAGDRRDVRGGQARAGRDDGAGRAGHRARPLRPSRRLQDRLEQEHGGHALPGLRDAHPQGALPGRRIYYCAGCQEI